MTVPGKFYNRGWMNVASAPGIGNVSLAGAAFSGYRTFAHAGCLDGDHLTVLFQDGSNVELTECTYQAASTSLVRNTVRFSISGGVDGTSLLSLSAATTAAIVEGGEDQLSLASGGVVAGNVAFNISPTGPTPAPADNSTKIATTAFVQSAIGAVSSGVTNITAGSGLTGGGSGAVTLAVAANGVTNALTAQMGATTIKGNSTGATANAADLSPSAVMTMLGAAPLASPAFTGTPTAPTATVSTNTTQVATTAYVLGQASSATPVMNGTAAVGVATKYAREDHVHPNDTSRAPIASPIFTGTVTIPAGASISGYAPLASPTFTGTPTAPTVAPGTDNSTKLATTAFVQAAVSAGAAGVASFNTRTGAVTLTAADVTGVGGALLASPAFTGTPTAPQYGLGAQIAISGIPASTDWFFGNAGNSTVTGSSNVGIGPSALSGVTSGNSNTAVGMQALNSNTTGSNSVAVGLNALYANTTASNNTAIGYYAANLATGANNTCVGANAGSAITSGGSNIVIGNNAGAAVVTGSSNILIGGNAPSDTTNYINIGNKFKADNSGNVFAGTIASTPTGASNINLGNSAGNSLTTGQYNINIGLNSGLSNSTSNFNTNIGTNSGQYFTTGPNTNVGYGAGIGVSGSTTGNNNTNLGYTTGTSITTGSNNTHVGHLAGGGITTGLGNVMVGYLAGFKITTTNYNTIVGQSALSNATIAANNVAIGASVGAAIVTGSNNILIGFGVNAPSDTNNYINIGGCITGQMNTGPLTISQAVIHSGSIGVFGTTPPAKPTVSGAKGSNAALASLIAALVSYGLITDTTTA